MAAHADWLVPDWPAPAGVHAVFTSRAGGHSLPPFATLNLGTHVGDQPAQVVANRALLAQAIGAHPVFMEQVHGTAVLTLEPGACSAGTPQADACLTVHAGLACTVMVADCLPVLLTSVDGLVVAAAHAGWRGLCNGVLEATLAQMRRRTGAEIMAWLGPAIGPAAFEVGAEVRDAFLQASVAPALTGRHFQDLGRGKYLASLPALARERLEQTGVRQISGNDASAGWCTVGNPARYYSHRRDAAVQGSTGRMAACIWRQRAI